jgi:ABC-type glycerol-3-phosphate transport system substrate-binding protein
VAAFDMGVADIAAGPRGERGMRVYTSTMPNYSVGITKSCKVPEAAMRWLDFVYSDQGAELFAWSIKGVSYDIVNGKRTYLGDYAKFDGALMAAMTLRPNLFVHRIEQESTDYAYNVAYPVDNEGYKRSSPHRPVPRRHRGGQRPVSDWDELVTKLKGLGYDKYQSVINAAYKRYYALANK